VGRGGRELPIVVKIGGSLVESGSAESILETLIAVGRPVVVVPGGGAFADAVRAAQKRLGFSDTAAHDMAILAMHQTAQVLCELQPRLRAAETLDEIATVVTEGRLPVWLPLRLSADDSTIPRDWSITSDGLAARLAERLGGARVVLVKSCDVPAGATASELAAQGIVDPVFAEIVARAGLDWRVLGRGSVGALAFELT